MAQLLGVGKTEAGFNPRHAAFEAVQPLGLVRHIRMNQAKPGIHGCQSDLDAVDIFPNERDLGLNGFQNLIHKFVGNRALCHGAETVSENG